MPNEFHKATFPNSAAAMATADSWFTTTGKAFGANGWTCEFDQSAESTVVIPVVRAS